MIYTKDISFQYTDKIFTFPDILCQAKEALLITGNSGIGKTTFLHLLCGLLAPKSGKIVVDNTDISLMKGAKLDEFRGKNIGIILQKSYFIDSLSVLENLELTSWLAVSKKQSSFAKELLSQLGLGDFLHQKTYQLSVGQQQRVSCMFA